MNFAAKAFADKTIEDVGSREYFDKVDKRKYLIEPHIPISLNLSDGRAKKYSKLDGASAPSP